MDKDSQKIFEALYDLHDRYDEDPKHMICADGAEQIKKLREKIDTLKQQVPHWISVKEELPEVHGTDEINHNKFDVLVYVPERDGCHQSGYFLGKLQKVRADNTGDTNFWGVKTPESDWTLWGWSYFEKPIPSYWMPLPEPPEAGEKE